MSLPSAAFLAMSMVVFTFFASGCSSGSPASSGAGSSGSSSSTGGSATVTSCDGMVAGQHVCAEYEGLTDAELPLYEKACATSNETWGTGCNHSGSFGGCRATTAAYDLTATTWYYSISTAMVMATCASAEMTLADAGGGTAFTYVSP